MDVIDLSNANVLVVDDQPANIQVIHQVLNSHYNIFMAMSGQQALDLCSKQTPDIILLDVVMPDISGLEVCRRLKSNPLYTDIPVIFITSFTDTKSEIECWDAGCVDFVVKPINQLTLTNRVKAHLTLKYQADILKRSAFLDGLTGVYNRRYFDLQAMTQWKLCLSNKWSFSVALLDIDFFKRFNDCYGHLEGDDCLRRVAKQLSKLVADSKNGFFARYGGEEFAVVLPKRSFDDARDFVSKACSDIVLLEIPHKESECSEFVTISAGCVYCDELTSEITLEIMLEQADRFLYQAKQAGRNQAVIEGVK